MDLTLVLTKSINDVSVDGYYGSESAWFTREQIGSALEYSEPRKAVEKIHAKHKDRLDPLSVVTKLVTTDGKAYDTYVYGFKGVLEICRWSKQPKANMVMDALYDMAEEVVRKGYYAMIPDHELVRLVVEKYKNDPSFLIRLRKPSIEKQIKIDEINRKFKAEVLADVQAYDLWRRSASLTREQYVAELQEICKDAPRVFTSEMKRWNKRRGEM